jgi:hypothetical protein
MKNKFDTFYESVMNDAGDDLDKENIAMIESHMAKVNLNLGQAGEIAADAASPGVTKRAGELGKVIQNQLHDFMDNFGGTSEEDAEGEFDGPGMQWDGIDDESSMDATSNITGEINGNGRKAAECISDIYALVEDEGQEMLDKQAVETLGDIIKFASNLHKNLKNRLD